MIGMATLRARVMQGGRVEVVDRVDLPEGTELELNMTRADDELDEAERQRLDESLARSEADIAAGRTRPFEDFIAERRQNR